MLESLALGLVKTLIAFLFKSYVATQSSVHIEGAPRWYMQNTADKVCVYDYQTGGLDAIDRAKQESYVKMNTELTNIIEAVIYQNYSDLKDPKEKQFVMAFKNDKYAPVFIRKTMTFPNIDYRKSEQTAFVKACIDKDTIVEYQKKRINKIKYALTHKHADDAFKEMESGDMSLDEK
jgi:hypothetical protein